MKNEIYDRATHLFKHQRKRFDERRFCCFHHSHVTDRLHYYFNNCLEKVGACSDEKHGIVEIKMYYKNKKNNMNNNAGKSLTKKYYNCTRENGVFQQDYHFLLIKNIVNFTI